MANSKVLRVRLTWLSHNKFNCARIREIERVLALFLNENLAPKSTSACRYYFTSLGRSVPSVRHCLRYCECLLHPPQDLQWEVSGVRYHAQSTRARVYRPTTNFHHSRYIMRVYRTRCPEREKRTITNRPLRRPDVELYGNERQIAITFPKERRYLLLRGRFSDWKCGDVRKRLRGISLVNILLPVLILYIKQLRL